MARMSIDDKFLRDPRVAMLAERLGWSVYEARGRLLEVFAICYDQMTPAISPGMIDLAGRHVGLAKAMVECELARVQRSGKYSVSGAAERVAYLVNKRDAGKQGGRKRSLTESNVPKHEDSECSSTTTHGAQAFRNPIPNTPVPDSASVPDPVPDPVPVPEKENTESAPSALVGSGVPRGTRKPKSKQSDLTEAERASVHVILGKLGENNGIQYSGSDAHTKLIVRQLRAGRSEMDLRKVIAFCADKWLDDERMRDYLRPETLFGPESIEKYLGPALAKFAAHPSAKAQPPSQLVADLRGESEAT